MVGMIDVVILVLTLMLIIEVVGFDNIIELLIAQAILHGQLS